MAALEPVSEALHLVMHATLAAKRESATVEAIPERIRARDRETIHFVSRGRGWGLKL